MYCPSAFRQNDLATLHQQIQASGLALLSSAGEQGLQASHLPAACQLLVGRLGSWPPCAQFRHLSTGQQACRAASWLPK